ncbi:MAG: hypothetical protein QNJ84_17050 [Alphaproteobacteria bacterium]|nr:hypothetical protein [Alphaproteobacteria bacterium]
MWGAAPAPERPPGVRGPALNLESATAQVPAWPLEAALVQAWRPVALPPVGLPLAAWRAAAPPVPAVRVLALQPGETQPGVTTLAA